MRFVTWFTILATSGSKSAYRCPGWYEYRCVRVGSASRWGVLPSYHGWRSSCGGDAPFIPTIGCACVLYPLANRLGIAFHPTFQVGWPLIENELKGDTVVARSVPEAEFWAARALCVSTSGIARNRTLSLTGLRCETHPSCYLPTVVSRYRRGVIPSNRTKPRLIMSTFPNPADAAICFSPLGVRSSSRRAASTRI